VTATSADAKQTPAAPAPAPAASDRPRGAAVTPISITGTKNSTSRAAAAAAAGQFPASRCPGPQELLSAAGCPCTVHADYPAPATDPSSSTGSSNSGSSSRVNVCPAGFRCSPSSAAAVESAGCQCSGWEGLAAAGRQQQQQLGARALGVPSIGICMPCQLGEWIVAVGCFEAMLQGTRVLYVMVCSCSWVSCALLPHMKWSVSIFTYALLLHSNRLACVVKGTRACRNTRW
jgi:hypothetical protein